VPPARPLVTFKYGASLDGRLAAVDGSSRWITCAESREDVHRLRAESDAVVVGSGTQRIDDPHLAVRHVEGKQPTRVVVDSKARTPATARVVDDVAPTMIAVAEDAHAEHLAGLATVLRLPRSDAGLDLEALLAALAERGLMKVLLEGGPTLAGSFVRQGLVDRIVGYVAPVVIGGDGLPMLAGPGAPSIDLAQRFTITEVARIGTDIRLVAMPLSQATD
jgi:diaminohydroxyphosphoribosylaminopyrimidine deaminase/5-amino-6-(5-phosphoribosylamino)uracil reductase